MIYFNPLFMSEKDAEMLISFIRSLYNLGIVDINHLHSFINIYIHAMTRHDVSRQKTDYDDYL